MLKKRISLLVVVALGVTALALAFSTGTSEAQGPAGGPGGAGRGSYGPGNGSQGVPPVGSALRAGNQYGDNAGMGVNAGAGFENQSMVDTVAKVLGIDSADVLALRQQGLTYAEIAAEQGMDLETLTDRVVEQHQVILQAHVDAGLLSPDQMGWMQVQMRKNVQARLTSVWEVGASWGYSSGYGRNPLNQAQMTGTA